MVREHVIASGKEDSPHKRLKESVKKILEARGYEVYDSTLYISEKLEELTGEKPHFGKNENPDLLAVKEKEFFLVELKAKETNRFVKQIENYSETGIETKLLVDADIENVELLSLTELKE